MAILLIAAIAAPLAQANPIPGPAGTQAGPPETEGNGLGAPGQPSSAPGPIQGSPVVGQPLTRGTPAGWQGGYTVTIEWLRCDVAGNFCEHTADTDGSHTPAAADINHTFRIREQAKNTVLGGYRQADSPATSIVRAVPPNNPSPPPSISGTVQAGATLTGSPGSWNGTGPFTYEYQWYRCDAIQPTCDVAQPFAADNHYTLVPADRGKRILLRVRATGPDFQQGLADSSATGLVADNPPTPSTGPTISGTPRDGQTLTVNDGTWTGAGIPPQPSFAHQWQRCNPGCVNIPSATGTTYTLTPTDVGSTVRAVVAATTSYGTAVVNTPPTGTVLANPPVNTSLPSVSGTLESGQVLTASPGSWSGTQPITFRYQWFRCDVNGQNCVIVKPFSASNTYTLAPDDRGNKIVLRVEATGPGPSNPPVTADAPITGAVKNVPPEPHGTPAAPSGETRDGVTLTHDNAAADAANWSPAPTGYLRQWQRCNGPGNCTDIAGATGLNYQLTSADYGRTIRVLVRAIGPEGTSPVPGIPSAETTAVTANPPVSNGPPTLPANAVRGIPITAGNGNWGGTSPQTFTYQWFSCDDPGTTCSTINGANSASYTPVGADLGRRLKVEVTAHGPDGAAAGPVGSNLTDNVVAATPPSNQSRPTIEGVTAQGSTLSASPGFWQGTAPITFGYQWSRCAAGSCNDIPGATRTSYTLTATDVGKQIKVKVTGTNVADSGTAESALTATITTKPTKVTPPKNTKKGKRMKPFPKVQIGGLVAPAGAFLTVLRVVNVPKGAKVTIKCSGRSCPFKSTRSIKVSKKRANVTSLLKRPLFNGTTLVIRVTKKGYIGKYTRIKIRPNRAPARVDACVDPGKTKPHKC